jgi:invasion protein IalB
MRRNSAGVARKIASVLGMTVALATIAAPVSAQQQPKKNAPAAAPAQPAPQQQGAAPKQPTQEQAQSAWVKLCEKATLKKQDKEEKLDICLTHHERLDGGTGMVIVSAALREVQGNPKKHLMIMVPLGVALPAGVQIKIDDEKEATKLAYTICHPGGCTAEIEVTPPLVEKLKKGKQMMVAAMNVAARPIFLPVPLEGFEKTLAGEPVDPKIYSDARKNLMQQIFARQQELLKKAEEDAKSGAQPGAAPAAQGSAPPATGSTKK